MFLFLGRTSAFHSIFFVLYFVLQRYKIFYRFARVLPKKSTFLQKSRSTSYFWLTSIILCFHFYKNLNNTFTDFNLFKIIVRYWWYLPVNLFTSYTTKTKRRISCYEISKSKNTKKLRLSTSTMSISLSTMVVVFHVFASW